MSYVLAGHITHDLKYLHGEGMSLTSNHR